jgi:hypothetical protein
MRNRVAELLFLSGAIVLGGGALLGQNASSQAGQSNANQQSPNASQPSQSGIDQQIQMLRQDLRSQRKAIIAANMDLTGDQAEKFWPVYNDYVAELIKINNAKYELVKEYAQSDTLSDAQVDTFAKRWLDVDESVVQLRRKYLPIFRNVLPAKSAARFFQLDRRVQMMIDLQVASSLPLVQP